jgi:exopolysaccharide biosynthesis polyprenyl glycosylphosphotransferase
VGAIESSAGSLEAVLARGNSSPVQRRQDAETFAPRLVGVPGGPPDNGAEPAGGARRYQAWSRRYTLMVVLLDALVAMLAVIGTIAFYPPAGVFSRDKVLTLVMAAALAWPLAIALCHGYDRNKLAVGDHEVRAVLRSVVLAIAAGAVPSALVDKYGVVALSAVAIPAAGALSLVVRVAARQQLHRSQRLGRNLRRVVLVGSASATAELNDVLAREQRHGMLVLGACVPAAEIDRAELVGVRVLGSIEETVDLVRAHDADAVAVTGGAATRHSYLRELSWALEGAQVELLVHPGLVEVAGPRMHIRPYVGLPLLHIEQPHFSGWRRFIKRATDLVLTAVGLVVISPVLLAIAAAIKVDDGGPVLFKQTRVGLDGSTFTMWKFRSMHTDAEERLAELRRNNPGIGLMFKMQNDPRITRVGRFLRRFSLDELPQLFNVMSGSMSLVGPRPPLPSEVDTYESAARRRLLVTPGLTGLWQVSGRSLLSWEETVRLDLRYVENWTLTLDLLILWKTFFAVVGRRGAF